MATRAAQQALAPGRVLLLRVPGSGITELGVICSDAPDSSSSGGGGGGSSLGGLSKGRGLDDFFSSGGSGGRRGVGSGSAAAGDAIGDSSGSGSGGRKYVVLYLHRPSPLDPVTTAPAAAAAQAGAAGAAAGPGGTLGLGPGPAAAAVPAAAEPPAAAGGGGLPGEPMLRLKKKVRAEVCGTLALDLSSWLPLKPRCGLKNHGRLLQRWSTCHDGGGRFFVSSPAQLLSFVLPSLHCRTTTTTCWP